MSTRSIAHFTYGDEVIARIYRHTDGYPEGAGTDIKRFFKRIDLEIDDTRFSDPSYLAAKYVVFLAEMFAQSYDWERKEYIPNNSKFDFLSVGVMNADPGDVEFIYKIDCDNLDANGFPTVQCFSVYGQEEVAIPEPDAEQINA